MDIQHIESLIKHGETDCVEFKKSTMQLHAALETLCAFLNGKGGTVLLGVSNDGKLIGQDVSDHTQQEIANGLNKLEPSAIVNVHYIILENNKSLIVMHVDKSEQAPYTYDGRAFYRNQSTTMLMLRDRYHELLVQRGQIRSWETLVTHDYTIDDLDHEEIRRAVAEGIRAKRVSITAQHENLEDILKSWNLLKKGKLNNAAVVLFAKNTMPYYSQCHLKLGRFRGTEKNRDFIDNKQFFGNAFRMFEEANSFIMRHLPIASFFKSDQLQRQDQLALPVLAIREALVNALCHRDYSHRSGTIFIAIFDDHLSIWNTGKLPADFETTDLNKKHYSDPVNKIISKVFYDRAYFDGWGTGIMEIFELCQQNNLPAPTYEEYSGGVEITFKFKEPIAYTKYEINIDQLNTRQKEIIAILQQYGAVGLKKIISELNNPPSERMIRKDLAVLKEIGLIELEGFAKTAVWKLKS